MPVHPTDCWGAMTGHLCSHLALFRYSLLAGAGRKSSHPPAAAAVPVGLRSLPAAARLSAAVSGPAEMLLSWQMEVRPPVGMGIAEPSSCCTWPPQIDGAAVREAARSGRHHCGTAPLHCSPCICCLSMDCANRSAAGLSPTAALVTSNPVLCCWCAAACSRAASDWHAQ